MEKWLIRLAHNQEIGGSNPPPAPKEKEMTQFLEYIDKPSIPEDLIKEIYLSLEGKNIFVIEHEFYQIFDSTENLKKFTRSIFDFPHVTRVQRITGDLEIHIDFNRITAFNYIIEEGGSNVETCFYNENHDLLETYCVPKFKWHKLKVDSNHNVRNVTSPRIALTVHTQLNKKT